MIRPTISIVDGTFTHRPAGVAAIGATAGGYCAGEYAPGGYGACEYGACAGGYCVGYGGEPGWFGSMRRTTASAMPWTTRRRDARLPRAAPVPLGPPGPAAVQSWPVSSIERRRRRRATTSPSRR